MQLGRRPFPSGEGARVEGHKHRVQGGWGRLVAALAGGGDRPLSDGVRVARRIAKAVAGKALRSDGQLAPSSAAAAFTLLRCSARA